MLFGSGEQTSVGRAIFEDIFARFGYHAPVRIGILETPTGFEVNAIHGWPERQQIFFERHVTGYRPVVQRIRAWRKDGTHSTNSPAIVDTLLDQDFIYSGAGSPSYVVRHLRGTRALRAIKKAHARGTALCFGSATAVASSTYALPVYEIFKAGDDLHWIPGLDLFHSYGIKVAIVPHWNNTEGEDFDSSRCWMGAERFRILASMLPADVTILGIDETTAVIVDFKNDTLTVTGTGNAHRIRGASEMLLVHDTPYRITEVL